MNEILFEWYKRSCTSNMYPNCVMLKEQAMTMKEQLQNSDSDDFSVSDGQLDCWKTIYFVKERAIVGETGGVFIEKVTSQIETINEWIEGYSLEKIWNMDESGCFFKGLSNKLLAEKGKQPKFGKKLKKRLTMAFLLMKPGKRSINALSSGRVNSHALSRNEPVTVS